MPLGPPWTSLTSLTFLRRRQGGEGADSLCCQLFSQERFSLGQRRHWRFQWGQKMTVATCAGGIKPLFIIRNCAPKCILTRELGSSCDELKEKDQNVLFHSCSHCLLIYLSVVSVCLLQDGSTDQLRVFFFLFGSVRVRTRWLLIFTAGRDGQNQPRPTTRQWNHALSWAFKAEKWLERVTRPLIDVLEQSLRPDSWTHY